MRICKLSRQSLSRSVAQAQAQARVKARQEKERQGQGQGQCVFIPMYPPQGCTQHVGK